MIMRPLPLLLASSRAAALLPTSVSILGGCMALCTHPIRCHRQAMPRASSGSSGMMLARISSPSAVVVERDEFGHFHVDEMNGLGEEGDVTSSNIASGALTQTELRDPPSAGTMSASATTTRIARGHILGDGSATGTARDVEYDGRMLPPPPPSPSNDEALLGRAFVARMRELETYRNEYGDCLVPKRYNVNPSLGNWVNKQRQSYRKYLRGEKTSMNETRIAALNVRGFVWDATSLPLKTHRSDNNWQRMYDQLSQYRNTNGHCRVPSSCSLGQWVVRQRFLYRRLHSSSGGGEGSKSSSLTEERTRLLNELDFQWSSRSEGTWDGRMRELREFKSRNGHVLVPRTYPPNPQLSAWVATQRKNYNRRKAGKTSPLTMGRIRELDEIGFVWCFWDYNFKAANEELCDRSFLSVKL